MKPKAAAKLAVDILMTLGLLFLMGYQFWGDVAHEWAGQGCSFCLSLIISSTGTGIKACFMGSIPLPASFSLSWICWCSLR